MQIGRFSRSRGAVVAIPANDEESHIAGCLAALAMQRDRTGSPVSPDSFELLVFANNCSDNTAGIARDLAERIPQAIHVVEGNLPDGERNAGSARKRAMNLAATRLAHSNPVHGVILTTDADSRVGPTWFAETMRELDAGADCVAGYIDGAPVDLLALGAAFLARGRLEDTYLSQLAEISARCDPRKHDLWPNHRVSSGASLAITLAAYSAIGGLPAQSVGEDRALTQSLERAGFRVRHSMDVCVTTSCRLEGRAEGGAADTMRLRHAIPDAPCDDEMEPALKATRRAIYKGIMREVWSRGPETRRWPARLKGSSDLQNLFNNQSVVSFEDAWQTICALSPVLRPGALLIPSALPREIRIAQVVLKQLRMYPKKTGIALAGTSRHEVLSS